MSRIAEARTLANLFIELSGALDANKADRLRAECPLAYSLAEAIGQELVDRVNERGLAVLDNGVKNAEMLRNEPNAHQALTLEPTENYGGSAPDGPIFPVGSAVSVRHTDWVTHYPSDTVQVWAVSWNEHHEAWSYVFGNADVHYNVLEGDLRWDVQPLA
jgi:hypothetical protein